jgi:hypothetical protein
MAEDSLRQGDHNGFKIEELDPKIYKNIGVIFQPRGRHRFNIPRIIF